MLVDPFRSMNPKIYSSFAGSLQLIQTRSMPSIPSPSPSILSLLSICRTSAHLQQVHAHIIHKGLEQDHNIASQFILRSSSFSTLSYCISFFRRILCPSIVLWNSLLKGYCMRSSWADVVGAFACMRKAQAAADAFTYPLLIKSCAGEYRMAEGSTLHGMVVRVGLDVNVFVGTALVDMYGKCKEIECARKLFDLMSERNVVSWTAMFCGYLNGSDLGSAKFIFDEMPHRNRTSWNCMIGGLIKLEDLEGARKLFDEMPDRDIVSFTTMIDGYAKAGDMESAKSLFQQVPQKDAVALSSMISGYVRNGLPNEAIKVFTEDIWSKNGKPDEFILVGLMTACSRLGCSKLAEEIDSYVNHQGSINHHIVAALVDMNAKCGHIDRAMKLFEELPKRDVISYCSMMQGLWMHGNGAEAVSLFNRMIKEGLTPDNVVFTVILTGCSRAGLVHEGIQFFELMQRAYSIVPSPDHYACMVDLFSRSGRLEEAYDLLNAMPVEPDASAWGALLGGCQLHRNNTELAKKVAQRLFKIEPQNAGNYVMLSNIYADDSRWGDVYLLRDQMDERGLRKIPGCTRIS